MSAPIPAVDVEQRLHNGREADDRDQPFTVDGWLVDPLANQISRDGTTTQLEPQVMRVLAYLAARRGQVVRREELLARVWDVNHIGDEALSRCISILRRVFNDDTRDPHVIETISKTGYRLIGLDPPAEVVAVPVVSTPRIGPSHRPRRAKDGSPFGGTLLRMTALHAVESPISAEHWTAMVGRAQDFLGIVGVASDSVAGRGWTFSSWGRKITLTAPALDEAPDKLGVIRAEMRDGTLLWELAPVVVGVFAVVCLAVGFGALGFAAPIAFGAALALAVTSALSLIAVRRIRQRRLRMRRDLRRFLASIVAGVR